MKPEISEGDRDDDLVRTKTQKSENNSHLDEIELIKPPRNGGRILTAPQISSDEIVDSEEIISSHELTSSCNGPSHIKDLTSRRQSAGVPDPGKRCN